jgi:zinc transporter ZupT
MIYILLGVFSFATPLGISIGMAVSGSSELVEIVFSSLAGGTFVYIACSEVVVEEFSVNKFKIVKILMFIFGAAIITCLGFIEG